jgi:hypothetical protein
VKTGKASDEHGISYTGSSSENNNVVVPTLCELLEHIKEMMTLLKQRTETEHHVVHVANIKQGATVSDKLQ